jgi:hypothetical protein
VEGEPAPTAGASDLIEALKARGVTPKTAAGLVEAHPATRVRTKIEVFDWLVKNEDKRVGKNPAGYLVASIRSDYQAPGDYAQAGPKPAAAPTDDGGKKRKAKDDAVRVQAREAKLRERWEKLSEAERAAVVAVVKAENPGIGRFKNMLEPLCLAELEKRLSGGGGRAQQGLFPDAD